MLVNTPFFFLLVGGDSLLCLTPNTGCLLLKVGISFEYLKHVMLKYMSKPSEVSPSLGRHNGFNLLLTISVDCSELGCASR